MVALKTLVFLAIAAAFVTVANAECCGCPSSGVCPDGTGCSGFSCCAHGSCNIFCCNCDGGCRTRLPSIYQRIDSLHHTLGRFREIDTDGSNGIDFNEFTRFFSRQPFIESHRDTFNSHDHNGDGQISIQEFDEDTGKLLQKYIE